MFNDKTYNTLKFWAIVVLPALATFYVALAGFWGFPYPKQISGTIMAVDTLLGALLQISTSKYRKENTNE